MGFSSMGGTKHIPVDHQGNTGFLTVFELSDDNSLVVLIGHVFTIPWADWSHAIIALV